MFLTNAGSIYFASCSDETDMEHIWAEIDDKVPWCDLFVLVSESFWMVVAVAVAGQVQDVDSSINVLMSAGMSSPALRNVAAAGVNIATGLYWFEQLYLQYSYLVAFLCDIFVAQWHIVTRSFQLLRLGLFCYVVLFCYSVQGISMDLTGILDAELSGKINSQRSSTDQGMTP